MAMNANNLKSEIVAALQAEFGDDYENIPDNHELAGYDQDTYWNRYWGAVASAIITHITTNGLAVGTLPPNHTIHALNIT